MTIAGQQFHKFVPPTTNTRGISARWYESSFLQTNSVESAFP
jgi:hypothetical protein